MKAQAVLLGFVGALCFATAAAAQTTVISGPRGVVTITQTWPQPPAPDLRTDQERKDRETAWHARCNPTLSAPNANGVQHYVYAAPGCEYGD